MQQMGMKGGARLRQRYERATQGEWFNDYGKLGVGDDGIGELDRADDGEFVAAVHDALPALLDVVEAAEAVAEPTYVDADRVVAHVAFYKLTALREALDRLDKVAP